MTTPRRLATALAGLCAVLAAALVVTLVRTGDDATPGTAAATPPADDGTVLFRGDFADGTGLISNELAHREPDLPGVVTSPDWEVTSGSLFHDDGAGWSGRVDGGSSGTTSQQATGSAVLRAVTDRADFGDVALDAEVRVDAMTTTPRTPEHAWDGVHLMLRYTDADHLYYLSACRRDGTTAIKKKSATDDSEGEAYATLVRVPLACDRGGWTRVRAEVVDEPDGGRLSLSRDGVLLASVLDTGQGGVDPLRGTGRVGLRGDNTEFHVRDLTVSAVG